MSAPDLTKKVLGFREWTISQGRLRGLAVPAYWPAGVQKARCASRNDGGYIPSLLYGGVTARSQWTPCTEPPGPKCHCGLYALHAPHRNWWLPSGDKWTCGVILGWGRMEVHRNGFRSEFAEPVLLAYDELRGPKHVDRVQRVAEFYGVATCALDDLEQRSREFGDVVPDELLPAKPESPDPTELQSFHAGGSYGMPPAMHFEWTTTTTSESPKKKWWQR